MPASSTGSSIALAGAVEIARCLSRVRYSLPFSVLLHELYKNPDPENISELHPRPPPPQLEHAMKSFTNLPAALLLLVAALTLVAAVPPSPPCKAQIDACKNSGYPLRLQTVCDDSADPPHGTTYLCAHKDGSVAFLTECEPHCPPSTGA